MQRTLDSGNLTVRIGDFSVAWLDQSRAWLTDADEKLLASAKLQGYRPEDFELSIVQRQHIQDSAICCTQFGISSYDRLRAEISYRSKSISNLRANKLNVAWLRLVVDCLRYDAAAFSMTLGLADLRLVEALLGIDDMEFATLCQGEPLMAPRFLHREAWLEFKRSLTTKDRRQIITHERQFLNRMMVARQQNNSLDS